jgi:ferric-dicitrate binding protein FerR (iron transport regulator)
MNEQAGSSRPTSQPDVCDDVLKRLAGLQLTLMDLLGAVDDDAQRMDASLEDAHRLVEEVRSCAKQRVVRSHGSMNSSACQKDYKAFEKARVEENDAYEVYSDTLERYQRRRMKDLSVAESDSDKLALVRRRRDYISKLLAFQAKASAILNELGE